MKTTLEIPDTLFRKAKASAAIQGLSLKDFVADALEAKLLISPPEAEKPWMKLAGCAARDPAWMNELDSIEKAIETEFEQIDEADWR